MGCEVHFVTSSQVLESEQFQGHLGQLADQFQSHVFANFENRRIGPGVRTHGPMAVAAAKQSLLRGLNKIKPDHVFFPSGNSVATWAGFPNAVSRMLRRMRIENEIILYFGKYCGYRKDWLSRWKTNLSLSMLSRGPFTRIHHVVPRAVEAMVGHNRRLAEIAHLIPDSVESLPNLDRFEARMMLGLPAWSRVVSLVGVIESEKGFMNCWRHSSMRYPDFNETISCFWQAGRPTKYAACSTNDLDRCSKVVACLPWIVFCRKKSFGPPASRPTLFVLRTRRTFTRQVSSFAQQRLASRAWPTISAG